MPLALSTAYGWSAAIASATFSAFKPPLRISGTFERRSRKQRPVEHLARAAAQALRARRACAGVEQMEVDVEALEVADVAGAGRPAPP